MGQERVSVIIVNYNLDEETEKCVRSLVKHVRYPDYEVVIVDNGSDEPASRSLTGLVSKCRHIKLVRAAENLGFGQGCNEGVRHSSGSVLCFLNPDTVASNDFIAVMTDNLVRDRSVVVAGLRINNPALLDFSAGFQPQLWLELLGIALIGRYIEALIVSAFRAWSHGKGVDVGWVLGACLFVRAEDFQAVNGFDRRFFLYFEEVDLCRRLTQCGGRCVYYSGAAIRHTGSVTGRKDYRMFTQRFYGSKYLFLRKHYASYYGALMRGAFYCQVASQMVLWTLLYPLDHDKARGKLLAFRSILKPRLARQVGD